MSTGDAGGQAAAQQGDGGQQGAEGQAAQGGPDLAQLAETLQSLQGGQEELRQFLAGQPWQQQEAGTPGPEAQPQQEQIDWSFLDPEDPGFDPQAMAHRLAGVIDQTMASREQAFMQQHVAPLNERLETERINREAQNLVDDFPELADQKVAGEVVSTARQIAESYGQPALANEPWFWRMTYQAGRAAQQAQDEGAETPEAAHLEGGAGARPGAHQQGDMGEQLFQSPERLGRRALPF